MEDEGSEMMNFNEMYKFDQIGKANQLQDAFRNLNPDQLDQSYYQE